MHKVSRRKAGKRYISLRIVKFPTINPVNIGIYFYVYYIIYFAIEDIKSGLVSEGSIKSVTSGKHYNRAVCSHKMMYEVLYEKSVSDITAMVTSMANPLSTDIDEKELVSITSSMEVKSSVANGEW